MIIDLSLFEQQIDPTILKRGLTYFKQGKVLSVDCLGDGEVYATIDGSDTQYNTTLKIEGDKIVENVCSCPYDQGAICKHAVALIFHLKQDELGIKVKEPSKAKSSTKSAAQKSKDSLAKILDSISKEQLVEFVEYLCTEHRAIKQEFISRYQPQNSANSKTHYKTSLSGLSRSLSRGGFMDYRSAKYFSNALDQVLAEADNRVAAGDLISAISAASAVLEEGTKAINHCDDSSGYIGGTIDYALNLLKKFSISAIDAKAQKTLFDYAIKSFNKGIFKGWDWHLPLLEVALNIATTPKEYDIVKVLIEAEINAGKDSSWSKEAAMELKAKLITKTISEEAAFAYMSKNISSKQFREHLIKHNIELNNISKAKELATGGLKGNGYDELWRGYLLKIAEKENDKAEVITQAKILLLSTYRHEQMQSYITILKSWLNEIEWIDFKLQLKSELGSQHSISELLFLLAELEQDWDLYVEQLSRARYYDRISDAEKKVPQSYYPVLAKLYYDLIVSEMSRQVGRTHYQSAARYIRRIIKLGQRDMANELTLYLRSTYPQRRALMEELDAI